MSKTAGFDIVVVKSVGFLKIVKRQRVWYADRYEWKMDRRSGYKCFLHNAPQSSQTRGGHARHLAIAFWRSGNWFA